jgi:hypothetical protein
VLTTTTPQVLQQAGRWAEAATLANSTGEADKATVELLLQKWNAALGDSENMGDSEGLQVALK